MYERQIMNVIEKSIIGKNWRRMPWRMISAKASSTARKEYLPGWRMCGGCLLIFERSVLVLHLLDAVEREICLGPIHDGVSTIPVTVRAETFKAGSINRFQWEVAFLILLGSIHPSRAVDFCFSPSHRYAPSCKESVRHERRKYTSN